MTTKLNVIFERDLDKFEKKTNEFLFKQKNIVRTSYSTCTDDDEDIYFTAFIEYRTSDE